MAIDRARFDAWLVRRATRRALLASGLGATALTRAQSLAGHPTRLLAFPRPGATPGRAAFAASPFTLGVASGDPLPDGVVLWTRLAVDPLAGDGLGGMAPAPVAVGWEVARDDHFREVVASGTVSADPALAHSVHVDVGGLAPAADYFYRFFAGGEVSPVGRTRTAPALDATVDRLRFAFCSCAHYEHGWFTAYRGMAGEHLDLVLHLGDYIYEFAAGEGFTAENGGVGRFHLGGETVSLTDYRLRHALYKTDRDLQAAHAAAPWVVTWDDHEVENGYTGAISENDDPIDFFLARRANAYQAYYEHMPLRPESLPHGLDLLLYRRLTYGDLADFSVLDTRQYRSDQPCGDVIHVPCQAADDPAQTVLGPVQERWLLQGLAEAGTTWKVIAQQVMMARLEIEPGPDDIFLADQWDGYPAARNRILGYIQQARIENPIVLTGDIHSTWINDLKADWSDEQSPAIGTEFVTTSITSGQGFGARLGQLLRLNPHVRFFDHLHGYSRCEVTHDRWQTDVLVLDDVTDPLGVPRRRATFVVERGRPGAHPG